jgi:hypothetical protein
MYMSYNKISFFMLAAVMLLMLSCNEDELLPPANTNAYISFINTSAFLGNVGPATVHASVETNGQANTNDLLLSYQYIYPEPNKYLPFKEGYSKVLFKDSTRKSLAAGTSTIRAGAYYSAILADSMDNYSALIIQDDYQAVADKALVRILHFSPDAGEISLYRDAARQEVFGNIKYKQVTPYIPLSPGANFSFILRRNDGTDKRVGRYFVPSLLAGSAYTILLKGYMEPPDGDVANKSSQIVFYRN